MTRRERILGFTAMFVIGALGFTADWFARRSARGSDRSQTIVEA